MDLTDTMTSFYSLKSLMDLSTSEARAWGSAFAVYHHMAAH